MMQATDKQFCTFPNFQEIKAEEIESQLTNLLTDNRKQIGYLLENTSEFTWDNFVTLLEALDDKLHRFWSPISHLHSVMDNPALRAAHQKCLPLLSDYETELGQNEVLYHAYKSLAGSHHYRNFNHTQQKIIEDELRDFQLSGIALPENEKKTICRNSTRISNVDQ